jgi:GH35 family endo-1,4-beta-xylanase
MRRTSITARRMAAGAALTLLAALVPQLASAPAHAATPFAVLPADAIAHFTEFKSLPTNSTQIVSVSDNANFTRALRVAVPNGPQRYGLDGEYEITLGVASTAAVTAGDAMVATLWARAVQPVSGATTGNVHAVFETDGSPWTKSMNVALRFGSGWQQFQFPIRAAVSHPAGGAHLNLWLGYGVQTFEIGGVSVTDYGPGNPAGYPSVTYAGRDPNAAWRTAANARIDQYRKGNLNVSVVDPAGKPVSGAAVAVSEQKSAFDFGAASDAAHLLGDPSTGETPTDAANYQNIASTLFNQGTLANDLKWPHWENQTARDTLAYPALQWMRGHGLSIRGHNLVWGSWGNMPADTPGLASNPAALRTRVNNHITDEASALSGIVDEWDVVNEPYSDHDVQDVLGPTEINSWYQLAHQADPRARLSLNDYGIVENNGWESRHQNYVYNLISSMKAAGVPLDVVGLESHFDGLQLTPPEDLMPIVDKFAALGVKVGVTEFDVATDDQQLQADYTRDFLTMMFSNQNVTELANFGFWAGNSYNPQTSLYNVDWSARPNALVWKDLIQRQWHTDVQGTSDASGAYGVRGFLGDYLVTVTVNGIHKQVKVSMPSTAGASVTVIADGIAISPATTPVNPVGDGDFETGTKGWVPLGTGPAVSTAAHSGTGALALTQGSGVTQNLYGLATGTSYLLSGWAQLSGPGTQCYIGVRGGATAGTPTFQYELTYADERAYTQKLLAFTPPSGTTWVQAFAWANPNPTAAVCNVDDVAITPTSGTAPPAQAPPAVTPNLAAPSILVNGTLENQASTSGWYCLGPCTLKNASITPHAGIGDLSVTARGYAWAGPAQGVTVANGGRYDSSAWVRLAGPGTDTGIVSLKVTTSTGAATTFQLGSATVTGSGWTQLSASNVKVTWSGTLTKAEWWISTTTGTGDLLVDDASFAPLATPVPGRDLLINGDAEQGTSNWYCFSPCVAQAASDQVHGGLTAVRATGRTYNYTGPAEGVPVTNGASYKTSAWVRMAAGAAGTTAQIQLKLNKTDGSSVTIPMASAAVSAGGWTLVAANNVAVSWTGTLRLAEWWVSTTTGADDFYLDDAALQPAGVEQTAFSPVQPTAPCVVHNIARNVTGQRGVSGHHEEEQGWEERGAVVNGTYTAYFGYSSANNFYIPVPVGAANGFSPAPADRGQTTYFLPYQRPKYVAVTWDGSPLTWQLDGYTQTASAGSPNC